MASELIRRRSITVNVRLNWKIIPDVVSHADWFCQWVKDGETPMEAAQRRVRELYSEHYTVEIMRIRVFDVEIDENCQERILQSYYL